VTAGRDKPLLVTQPYLPPLEEMAPYLEQIWRSRILTNGGPLHAQFERALRQHLDVPHIALFNNGTLALLTALQALRITGEVITTPYSFVATSHSLLWNGITPVFVDVDPVTLNLDPAGIEAALSPRTTAILAVHCYGSPCDTAALRRIAEACNLKVIYDAAHAFGVEDEAGSILRHGDLSVLSFHATKVFTTFEGGAIVCPDAATKGRIDQLKNFGFVNEVTVVAPGINGKMSEFNAALGLVQLEHYAAALARRKAIDRLYRDGLAGIRGIRCLDRGTAVRPNYGYFPIFVGPEYPLARDALYQRLKDHGISGRRYFYPLISEFPMYSGLPSAQPARLPAAHAASRQVICLPMHAGLEPGDVERVVGVIADSAA
jgi:dTDP-4-amino-4,6-dideoxygalactose transaminase